MTAPGRSWRRWTAALAIVATLATAATPSLWQRLEADGLHDPANPGISVLQQPGAGRVRLARAAARFDGHPLPVRPAPTPRQHTRELLRELGHDDAAIAALVAAGAVYVDG